MSRINYEEMFRKDFGASPSAPRVKNRYAEGMKKLLRIFAISNTRGMNFMAAWVSQGGALSYTHAAVFLSKIIERELQINDVPYISRRKGKYVYYCVRDINTDALTAALEKAKAEKQTVSTIYDYHSYAMKERQLNGRCELIHISNIDEIEAEMIRRELRDSEYAYNYAMTRMDDNRFMLTFSKDAFVNRKETITNQTTDVLTALLVTVLTLSGRNSRLYRNTLRHDLDVEMALTDRYQSGLHEQNEKAFIYDPSAPNNYIMFEVGKVSFKKVKKKPDYNGEDSDVVMSFATNDPFLESYIRDFAMNAGALESTKDESVILSMCKDKRRVKNIRTRMNNMRTLSNKEREVARQIVSSFEHYYDLEATLQEGQTKDILDLFTKSLEETIEKFQHHQYPSYMTKPEAEMLSAYIAKAGILIEDYTRSIQMVKDVNVYTGPPIEEKVAVKQELAKVLEEFKNPTHWDQSQITPLEQTPAMVQFYNQQQGGNA